MLVIDKELLDGVTAQAKASPRLRMNYNLHDSLEAETDERYGTRNRFADSPPYPYCRNVFRSTR